MDATQTSQQFDSKEEGYFAVALERLDLPYIYQYSIYGGTRRRGGYVIDFLLVSTAPASTAVNIDGAYWHKDTQEEAYERARIDFWCRTHGIRYVRILAERLTDVDTAAAIIKDEVL